LIVIDFDGWDGYHAFCEKFPDLADTHTVATGSGQGAHIYLLTDELPPNTEAKGTPLGSIELKGEGRQVAGEGSIHPKTGQPYSVLCAAPIRRVPDLRKAVNWIENLRPSRPQPPRQAASAAPKGDASHKKNYGQRALVEELAKVASATLGSRNAQLYESSLKLFALVKAGVLDYAVVENSLIDACRANGLSADDGERSVRNTIASAFKKAGIRRIADTPQQPKFAPNETDAIEDTTSAQADENQAVLEGPGE
jgi:hypothetical protein